MDSEECALAAMIVARTDTKEEEIKIIAKKEKEKSIKR